MAMPTDETMLASIHKDWDGNVDGPSFPAPLGIQSPDL